MNPSTRPATESRTAGTARTLAFGLVGTVGLLWVAGYPGLSGDAQLYALQALARGPFPELRADLFLGAASQDDFSLFSRAYAPLMARLGPSDAALVLTGLSLFVLFAASGRLLAQWAGRESAWVGLILLALWPLPYAPEGVFQVAEPVATPRLFASALSVLALSWALTGARAKAAAAGVAAALLHPLMAAPAIAVLVLLRWGVLRALMLGGALICVGLLAATLGIPLAERLMLRADEAWLAAVLERSPFLSPGRWSGQDVAMLLAGACAPALVAMREEGVRRWVLRATAGLALAGMAVTVIGGDLLRLVLVYQAQPWRAVWLAQWLSLGVAGLVLARWRRDRDPLDLLVAAAVLGAQTALGGTGPVILAAAWLAHGIASRQPGTRIARLVIVGSLLLSSQALVWRLLTQPGEWTARAALAPLDPLVPVALTTPFTVLLVILPAMLTVWPRAERWRRGVAMIALGVAVAVCAAGIARVRGLQDREFGVLRAMRADLLERLPVTGSIYWGEDGRRGWFGLGYPVYLSMAQTAGGIFSRQTALEAARRAAHLESVLGPQRHTRWLDPGSVPTVIVPGHLPMLCEDPRLSAVFVRTHFEHPRGIPVGRSGTLLLCAD